MNEVFNKESYDVYDFYDKLDSTTLRDRANIINAIEDLFLEDVAYFDRPITSIFELCAGDNKNLDMLRLTKLFGNLPYQGSDYKDFDIVPDRNKTGQDPSLYGIDLLESIDRVPENSLVLLLCNALSGTYVNEDGIFPSKMDEVLQKLSTKNIMLIVEETGAIEIDECKDVLYEYPNLIKVRYKSKIKNNTLFYKTMFSLDGKKHSIPFVRYYPSTNKPIYDALSKYFKVDVYNTNTLRYLRRGAKRQDELYFCLPK